MASDRRNYRKLYVRLWNNQEFRAMSDAGKTFTLYLLTGPQTNRVGLFRFSAAQAGEDLNKPSAQIHRLLQSVCTAFDWRFDVVASVLWIPTWWEYNPLTENPKNLQGYLSDLNDMPRTVLISDFCGALEHVPATLHSQITDWLTKLTPKVSPMPSVIEHRSVSDRNGARTTKTKTLTKTKTETQTETKTDAPSEERSASMPVRPAFEVYDRAFRNRYGGKPEYAAGKDGARMAKLLKAHGFEEVTRRLEGFFASTDPWIQRSGHTLDVFFSAGTQTKLIAERGGSGLLSDTARHNLASAEEADLLIQGGGYGPETEH